MNRLSHIWLIAVAALIGYTGTTGSQEGGKQPFRLVQTISLPNVKGRLDHMDVDVKRKRLFVAGLENGTLEVVDLQAGKWVRSIPGFEKPQGALYVPELNKLFVASGDDGMLRVFWATRSIFLTRSSLTVGPTASSTNLILNLSMSVTVVRTQGRTTERLESSTQRKTSASAISKLWPTPLSFCWTGRERRFLCSLPLPTRSR